MSTASSRSMGLLSLLLRKPSRMGLPFLSPVPGVYC